jgi:Ca-activated chloride channel family protein
MLAFGAHSSPRRWVHLVPVIRCLALAGLAWGLFVLLGDASEGKSTGRGEKGRRIVLVLDVSPSMYLADAGPGRTQTRADRARDILQSLFAEIDMHAVSVSVVAVYNGAKPAVIDCRDPDVIDNILSDLPLTQAFHVGRTKLLEGLRSAAKLARAWPADSATLLLVSDGDTVPDKGMPHIPASLDSVHVIGVGDPGKGKYIDGHMSRQNVGKLRSIARRLGGIYHDGNTARLRAVDLQGLNRRTMLTGSFRHDRQFALAGVATGAAIVAFLPLALAIGGTRQRRSATLMQEGAENHS